ncbi:sulfur carrier protein ThiS adenylyltransferase ThiF [Clostridium kluyveri]|uniref:sulfur carrier protein ThiS adenylyltransferase ThiF n=1 Tax=Clostridium kluyveri TaxID=1534 RepID=UPI002245D548|nr:sulfur carrier protein ThiS adenylyltransferase ThiF [Clostridium kluyveri]UZQ51151.1 sulfur carrier protein ThiS adenylyltransferase ThiF [Clostridium kluyveri]
MEVIINGKKQIGDWKTAFEVRSSLGKEDDVLIINGFQIQEDCILHPQDIINVIAKGVMPPMNELESMMAARHTPHVFEKVKKGKVAVAGLGGLGSNIAVMLARIGVGHLLLVDFDVVDPSNLNRQSYYVRHLGMLKTDALAEQIKEINPFIIVETKTIRIDESNVLELFNSYDIVCEAFDNPESKAMLVNNLLIELSNSKIVCASGMAGYGSSNLIKTQRKMKNLYICGDLESSACQGNGLMAPRVQICAGHQANMILRLLIGIEEI